MNTVFTVIFDATVGRKFGEPDLLIGLAQGDHQLRKQTGGKLQGVADPIGREAADHASAVACLRGSQQNGLGANSNVALKGIGRGGERAVEANHDIPRWGVTRGGQLAFGQIACPTGVGQHPIQLVLLVDQAQLQRLQIARGGHQTDRFCNGDQRIPCDRMIWIKAAIASGGEQEILQAQWGRSFVNLTQAE